MFRKFCAHKHIDIATYALMLMYALLFELHVNLVSCNHGLVLKQLFMAYIFYTFTLIYKIVMQYEQWWECQYTHTRTHACMHERTHTHTHARMHTHTQQYI